MNEELKALYKADVNERKKLGSSKVGADEELLEHVKEIIDSGGLKVAKDFYHAALIFQHGEASKDFQKANELARKAMEMGDERAKWLFAASLDRWLLSVGKPQKFGTQFIQNSQGEWEVVSQTFEVCQPTKAIYL